MSPSEGMRIDETAQVAGVTARNIRAYQSLGLLRPPRLAGRVGLYDAAHLRRLRAIGRLQARGFSLAGIKGLFDAYDRGEALGTVLGLDPVDEVEPGIETRAARLPALALVPGPWVHQLLAAPTTN
jgi:DNA-binding transcriptional MerR regulator